jgi:hypothetical protein
MRTVDLDPAELLDASPRPDVPPGDAFRAFRLRALTPDAFASYGDSDARLSQRQLLYLAWLGLLAPTSHNTVPQRFELRPEEGAISIWLDRERILPESDPDGRQAHVSAGCCVANIAVGARALGWATDVEVLPVALAEAGPSAASEPRYTHVLDLRFSRAQSAGSLDAIVSRKVVRAEYDERVKLDEDLPALLGEIATRHEGLALHLITDAPTLLFLAKFQEIADITVINRAAFSLELGEWFLDNDSTARVGMRGREFGLDDEATRRMSLGLRKIQPLLPDEIAGFAKVGYVGIRSSSAVAVITVQEDSLAQRIATGRAYEEMALLLTQRGFCTAMHAATTEVAAPNLALRGRLRTRSRIEALFRIGRPLHPADGERPHSSRPDISDVLFTR